MVEAGDAQGMTLGADSTATCLGTPNRPRAWAPSPPVPLPLAAQLEVLILDRALAALPVPQLHAEQVGGSAGEAVHGLVAQPVLSSHIPKTLWGGEERMDGCVLRREAVSVAEDLAQPRLQGHLAKVSANEQVHRTVCTGLGQDLPSTGQQ